MATILLTWELGGGIGHLMNLRPIGAALVQRGHAVVAALRDLTHAHEILQGTGIRYIAAPTRPRQGPRPNESTYCYTHLLSNIGFGDSLTLETLFHSWNVLFDLVKPDLVVADHTPSALLALRGRGIPCVNLGIGFFAPPGASPLPQWHPRPAPGQLEVFARDERELLDKVNALLRAHDRPPLEYLAKLYTELAGTVLATYREFDHFAAQRAAAAVAGRKADRYWGHWPHGMGRDVRWPGGTGPRIYAYLKSFPALEALLAELRKLAHPTVVFAPTLERALQERFAGPTLRFELHPLDLRQVAEQCDLAILNANHGTACTLLLAGKPCLLLPQFTEQLIFARKVEALGAGLAAPIADEKAITRAFHQILAHPGYRAAAERFRDGYAGFTAGGQVPELATYSEALLRTH